MKDYKDYNKIVLQDCDILKNNIKLMFEADNFEQIYNIYNDTIFRIRVITEFNNYRVQGNTFQVNN